MHLYRFYLFDVAGGQVESEREFHANNDEIAVRLAEGWRLGRKAELWQRDRQVKAWRFRRPSLKAARAGGRPE